MVRVGRVISLSLEDSQVHENHLTIIRWRSGSAVISPSLEGGKGQESHLTITRGQSGLVVISLSEGGQVRESHLTINRGCGQQSHFSGVMSLLYQYKSGSAEASYYHLRVVRV